METEKFFQATSKSRFSLSQRSVSKTQEKKKSFDYSILTKNQPYSGKNEVKKIIFEMKAKRKQELDNFHLNFLKNKYNSSKYFFLTDQKDTINSKEVSNFASHSNPPDKKKEKRIPRELLSNLENRESTREFIRKARLAGIQNYIMGLKSEKKVRTNEIYNNSIEEIVDKNTNLEKMKKLFTDEFLVKFDLYIKNLGYLKEKEQFALNSLIENSINVENRIKGQKLLINRLQDRLKEFKQYKNFLQCVKERVPKVEFTKKFKQIKGKMQVKDESFCSDGEVFEGENDMWDEMEALEERNIVLMDKLIETKARASEFEVVLDEIKASEDDKNRAVAGKIGVVERSLGGLKEKNERLRRERDQLLREEISGPDYLKLHIHKKCKEIVGKLRGFVKLDKMLVSGKDSQSKEIFEVLRILEKTFNEKDFLYRKMQIYKGEKVVEEEKRLDKEKKHIRAKENILKEAEHQAIKHQKIIENGEKVYVLPKKRAIGMSMPKLRKKRRAAQAKEKELEFSDLIEFTSVEDL